MIQTLIRRADRGRSLPRRRGAPPHPTRGPISGEHYNPHPAYKYYLKFLLIYNPFVSSVRRCPPSNPPPPGGPATPPRYFYIFNRAGHYPNGHWRRSLRRCLRDDKYSFRSTPFLWVAARRLCFQTACVIKTFLLFILPSGKKAEYH